MNKEERQSHIVQLIAQSEGQQMLGTRALAAHFGVSEMTVRRDLQELSQDGLLLRLHGGATPMRQVAKAQHKEVGIVLVSKTGKYRDPFFNAILEGADRKLQELGYRMAYFNSQSEVITAEQARDLLHNNPVDGIILVGGVGLEAVDYLRANLRAVVHTSDYINPEVDAITFDGSHGMRLVMNHLEERGYRRIGFIAGGSDVRHQSYLEEVKARHLPADPELCVLLPYGLDGWTPELGHEGAQKLMSLVQPPDAIVCASDRIAIGAIQWLHQQGFRVPEDIAITGWDNLDDSAFITPALTTVHVYKQLMGELAAERAVKRIENENEIPLLIRTPTLLVVRESSGSSVVNGAVPC